jgi:O-antigen/teichoic acid export membrane protein
MAVILSGLAGSVIPAILFSVMWLSRSGGLPQVLLALVISGCVSIVIGMLLLRRKLRNMGLNAPVGLKEILVISSPLMITSLTLTLRDRAGIWILGLFTTQTDIAVYGAAERLMVAVILPLLLVNSVIPPVIAELYARGERRNLEKTIRRVATLASIPAFAVLLGFLFFGPQILGLVYGNFYRQAGRILIVLSIAQLVNVWSGSCGIVLMMTGSQVTLMVITLVAGAVGVLLGAVLTYYHGALGMALAAAVALIVQNIGMWLSARINTGMWTHVSFVELSRNDRAR